MMCFLLVFVSLVRISSELMDKIHLRIGSATDNQLVIESSDVAPYHLELFCDAEGNVFITDLGSEQGTFINNQRLDGFKLLKSGDRVRFGSSYTFAWEGYIQQTKRKEVPPIIEEKPTQESPVVNQKNIKTNEINKQLYFIYGCIILLLVLMSLYL